MSQPVFISYARGDCAVQAQALATALKGEAFLDTESIDDGSDFPQRLLDALLASRIAVIFASKNYLHRRFCRVEMRLALETGDERASQIVLALAGDSEAVIDAMPPEVARANWPPASETARLADLVRSRLDQHVNPLGSRIPAQEARVIASLFLEEASIPEPRSLQGITVSFPLGFAAQSIGRRFVGRASDLRRLHNTLSEGSGSAARLACRVASGAGFGKTRLVIEYLNRFGPQHYPGGIFWINAESSGLDEELWRVLRVIDPATPNISLLRGKKPTITERLDAALRAIPQPVLYIADNVPESAPGEDPLPLAIFCPALGAVTVIATSRQDTREYGIESIKVNQLPRESAMLLLREDVPSPASVSWDDWGRIAAWVGDLPVALDLLNRALVLRSISAKLLLVQMNAPETASTTAQLDHFAASLQGQVPTKAAAGITSTFTISYERLDPFAQTLARILAQLAPTPIPSEFLEVLPEELNVRAARAALNSRHFVVPSDAETFGVMHRLIADFLRSLPGETETDSFMYACWMVGEVMTFDRCRDPEYWPLMSLCRPHAEALFTRGAGAVTASMTASEIGRRVATLDFERGDYLNARLLQERIVEIRKGIVSEKHANTLPAMHDLAGTLRAQGDLQGARELFENVVDMRRHVQGKEHPSTLTAMDQLAETARDQGDLEAAEKLHEYVWSVRRRVLGEEHRDTLSSMNNLALTLNSRGDLTTARELHKRVLEARKRVLGEEHLDTLASMNNLAQTLGAQGNLVAAQKLLEQATKIFERQLGREHPRTLVSRSNLAAILANRGRHSDARRQEEDVLKVKRRVLGEEHPDTLISISNLAQTLFDSGELGKARDLLQRALELQRRTLGSEHPDTLRSMSNLGAVLYEIGDLVAALALFRDCLAGRRRVLGGNHPDTIATAKLIESIKRQVGP